MATIIKAKKDLYNRGKCFTKDKEYTVQTDVRISAALIDLATTNDLGEPHIIGTFWRDFEII